MVIHQNRRASVQVGRLCGPSLLLPRADCMWTSIGNGLNLASAVAIACSGVALMAWERYDNKRREKIDVDAALAGLSDKEVEDLDWRHPSFRWKY